MNYELEMSSDSELDYDNDEAAAIVADNDEFESTLVSLGEKRTQAKKVNSSHIRDRIYEIQEKNRFRRLTESFFDDDWD